MATFLDLVKATERRGGTVPSILSTTVGQTGRHQLFVEWVQEAWRGIQTLRADWSWMREDFQGSLIAGVTEYDAGALGISERFRRWVRQEGQGLDFTSWLPADGQGQEGRLKTIPWELMRQSYMVGSNTEIEGRPVYVAVSPKNRLVIWPTPDAAYTLRGEYMKGPQELEADADIPEMPVEYHDAIKWRALQLMCEYDEAFEQSPYFLRRFQELFGKLQDEQTPDISFGDPLA